MKYRNGFIRGLIEKAREFRKEPTVAEAVLWRAIRNRALDGYKFRRQRPIDRFIVDFVCFEAKLVVEVDGAIHLSQKDYDLVRQKHIEAMGFRVIRFTNEEVLTNLEQVKEQIVIACKPSPDDLRHYPEL